MKIHWDNIGLVLVGIAIILLFFLYFPHIKRKILAPKEEEKMDIIKSEKLKQYSVADELLKWAKLKEDGHITEEEFDEARKSLLK